MSATAKDDASKELRTQKLRECCSSFAARTAGSGCQGVDGIPYRISMRPRTRTIDMNRQNVGDHCLEPIDCLGPLTLLAQWVFDEGCVVASAVHRRNVELWKTATSPSSLRARPAPILVHQTMWSLKLRLWSPNWCCKVGDFTFAIDIGSSAGFWQS